MSSFRYPTPASELRLTRTSALAIVRAPCIAGPAPYCPERRSHETDDFARESSLYLPLMGSFARDQQGFQLIDVRRLDQVVIETGHLRTVAIFRLSPAG